MTPLVLAGCGHDAPAPVPAPASPVAPASPPTVMSPAPPLSAVPTAEVSGAPPGSSTCAELSAAVTDATLMDPGVIDRIVAASSTADAPVADAAQRLAAAYAKASVARNTSQEPDAVAAVSAAAADMAGVCNQSGLDSIG